MQQRAKRVLILSNECLSGSTSNGRTLSNFLVGYPKQCLAQFSVQGVMPDFDRCEQYFCVTDHDAIQAFTKGKRVGTYLKPQTDTKQKSTAELVKAHRRTAVTMLLRDIIWNSGRWKKGGFTEFVENFKPEVLLLQAGDCPFMFRLARKLAKKYRLPLVIYNSEAYYFKKHDYFQAKGFAHLCYPIFRSRLRRNYRKLMKFASHMIYNCDCLRQDYDECFTVPSEVLYTATQLAPEKKTEANSPLRITYLGKLEVGRHLPLIRLAEILGELSPESVLDVYGNPPSERIEQQMRNCKHLRLCGFVPYAEVTRIMHGSDILVHVESFDDFFRVDSKYAFSTKIADSLACGTCFLFYAPQEFACSRYLKENDAAFVVSDEAQVRATLSKLLTQPQERERCFENAQRLVRTNHQADQNAARFAEILNTVSFGG